jgi:hypothetical protein
MTPDDMAGRVLAHAFNDELDKLAALTDYGSYKKKRKAAIKDYGRSSSSREAMMKSYMEDRGDDKGPSHRGAVAGGLLGAGAGHGLGMLSDRRRWLSHWDAEKSRVRPLRNEARRKAEAAATAAGKLPPDAKLAGIEASEAVKMKKLRGAHVGKIVGGVGGAAALGTLAYKLNERSRKRAKAGAKDPEYLRAQLSKTRSKRRLKREAELLGRYRAGQQGKRIQKTPFIKVDKS